MLLVTVVLALSGWPLDCLDIMPLRRDRPLSEHVTVTLEADRKSYYPGEPVDLSATFANGGTDAAHLYSGQIFGCFAEVYYRKVGQAFVTYSPYRRFTPEELHVRLPLSAYQVDTLRPGENRRWRVLAAMDAVAHRFVLLEPGTYEFKIVYRDSTNDSPGLQISPTAAAVQGPDGQWAGVSVATNHDPRNGELVSNVLLVQVMPPRVEDREAFDAYFNEQMGYVVQSQAGTHRYSISDADTERAATFLDRFPSSVYARHVRRGLLRELQQRMEQEATAMAADERIQRRHPSADHDAKAATANQRLQRDGALFWKLKAEEDKQR